MSENFFIPFTLTPAPLRSLPSLYPSQANLVCPHIFGQSRVARILAMQVFHVNKLLLDYFH